MKFKSSFLNEAKDRGFLYQFTNLDEMDEYLVTEGRFGYLGFDITAKSLHVGHLIPIFMLRLFQKHGHHPIVLMGGGTTKIGDPSFKNTVRPILTNNQIMENLEEISECLQPFLKFGNGESDAIIVNNADWLDELSYISFLREIGKYFSINKMIGFDSVKTKLADNNSLSFLEFNYMLLQAYDFYKLFLDKDCRIQFGGQDQWGNIICGVELIRKKLNEEVFGFTNPLLISSNGEKMGKTTNGAVWLSKKMLVPYEFWQYWRNVDDADVIKLLYLFTDIPVAEIKKMESVKGKELNELKILLADEITAIVHGRDELDAIHTTVANIFAKSAADLCAATSCPKYEMDKSNVETMSIIDVIIANKMCISRGDAKRLLRNGGVYVDGIAIDENYILLNDFAPDSALKFSCGKKNHIIIRFK